MFSELPGIFPATAVTNQSFLGYSGIQQMKISISGTPTVEYEDKNEDKNKSPKIIVWAKVVAEKNLHVRILSKRGLRELLRLLVRSNRTEKYIIITFLEKFQILQ